MSIPSTSESADFIAELVKRIHDTPHGEVVTAPATVGIDASVRGLWILRAQQINKETARRNERLIESYMREPVYRAPTETEARAWETERSRGMSVATWGQVRHRHAMRVEWDRLHPF